MPVERRSFISYDGEELYYHVTGSGPPVLLVNGFLCTTQYWPPVVDRLSRDHSVITWDYRGYGDNPVPRDLDTVTIAGFTRDMDALLEDFGAEKAVIAGHSMGVQVVFEFYKNFPQRTEAIITVCGTYENPFTTITSSKRIHDLLAWAARRLHPHSDKVGALVRFLLNTPLAMEAGFIGGGANRYLCPWHYLDELFEHVSSRDFRVVLRNAESMIRHSAQDVLSKVDVPVLIIGGERDGMTPPARSEEIHRAIPGSECKVYSECTHLAMVEKPEEVVGDMAAFLEKNGI